MTGDDFSFDVELLQEFTDEHPAQIEASLENVGDQPVTAAGGPTAPIEFSVGKQAEHDATLRAIPHDDSHLQTDPAEDRLVPPEPTNGCWTVDYDLLIQAYGVIAGLSSGEGHRLKYTILDLDNDTCLPAGTYRFAYSLRVTPGSNRRSDRPEPVPATFSFQFVIAEDGSVSVEPNEPIVEG